MPKPKDRPEVTVPQGLEWHHEAFQKLGIYAEEYDIWTFAFPKPPADQTAPLAIQADKKGLVSRRISELTRTDFRVPDNGIMRMPVQSMVATIDDDFDTEVRPASALFMNVAPGKTYDFVVALNYSSDRKRRWGRVLYLEPSDPKLTKKEWTDPGRRFSLKTEVIFYPSMTKPSRGPRGQERKSRPQISAIHPSGKRVVVARGCPDPDICQIVPVRLIERGSVLKAIPVTPLMTEKEIAQLEARAMSTDVNGKSELPPGYVYDGGEENPAWDSLNDQWAQIHNKPEAAVFSPDMPLPTFKQHYRSLLGKLSVDPLNNKHPALVRTRKQRFQMVSHWLDVMEAFLEVKAEKVSAVSKAPAQAKDNGHDDKSASQTSEDELKAKRSIAAKKAAQTRRQKAAGIKKAGKVTKPAQA